ncbi:hypothetical protein FKM82_030834, partial [Ascaphus truei]
DAKRKLAEAKKRLQDNVKKKDELQTELRSVQEKISLTRDNVTDDITSAKFKAAEANDTANRVEATLTDLKKNLDLWKEKYGNLQNEDVSRAVADAKTT